MWIHLRIGLVWTLAFGALGLAGCDLFEDEAEDAKKTVEEAVSSEVTGRVTDNRGEGVAGVTVRLYDLLDNTDFVGGSDIAALEAYIDREAVLASNNDVASTVTKARRQLRIRRAGRARSSRSRPRTTAARASPASTKRPACSTWTR